MKSNKLVSVMLPTRERVDLAKRSIKSLLETANCPEQIEVLIAFDCDDSKSQQYFKSDEWSSFVTSYGAATRVFETPAWGYIELQNYYNLMAAESTAQWLLLWNDDALMQTRAWDQQVNNHSEFMGMLHMTTENFDKKLTLFPFIPKQWVNLFGTLSLCNCNDSWIQDICREANAVIELPIAVIHDRFDVTGNNNDATYQNRKYQKKIYKSDAMRQTRHEWAVKFSNYRASIGACDASIVQTQAH